MFQESNVARPLHLLGRVEYVAACDLACVHQIVNLLELGKSDRLEWGVYHAAAEELERLGCVLAVAHVRSLDGDHLDDGFEHGSAQVGSGGESDADDGAARADVLPFPLAMIDEVNRSVLSYLCSLLERLLIHSDQDDRVRTLSVLSSLLHFLDDVLAGGKVNKRVGSELLKTHLLLLLA